MDQLDLFAQFEQIAEELPELRRKQSDCTKPNKSNKSNKSRTEEVHETNVPTQTCAFCVHAKENERKWFDCDVWKVEVLGSNGVCEKSDLYDSNQLKTFGNLYRIQGRMVSGIKQVMLAVEKGEIPNS